MQSTEPTASCWLQPGRARPLRAWRQDQLQVLAEALRLALVAWAGDWGLPDIPALACEPFVGDAEGAMHWMTWRGDAGACAWLRAPRCDAEPLAGLGTGPVASIVRTACLDDAVARLGQVLGLTPVAGDTSAPPPAASQPWSGAVLVPVPVPPTWLLVLNADALNAWLHGRATPVRAKPVTVRQALIPVTRALAGRQLALQVRLDGCELELGALQALVRGDVVRLRHPLDQPARLTDHDGRAVMDGYLAGHGRRKALALAASTNVSKETKS